MDMTNELIDNGFTVSVAGSKDNDFRPNNNWFGLSLYHPDVRLNKNDIEVKMSLQGISCPYNEKYYDLFKSRAVKYIRVKRGDLVLYEDWTGNLPPKELIESIIK